MGHWHRAAAFGGAGCEGVPECALKGPIFRQKSESSSQCAHAAVASTRSTPPVHSG
jgi:hypothetical protein